jgi:hypothetical protein
MGTSGLVGEFLHLWEFEEAGGKGDIGGEVLGGDGEALGDFWLLGRIEQIVVPAQQQLRPMLDPDLQQDGLAVAQHVVDVFPVVCLPGDCCHE